MQGTTHKVGNDCRGNGRDEGSSSSRFKQCQHLKIEMSSAYTEDPRTNDNYFSSKWDNIIGSFSLGNYGGSGKHSCDQSHFPAKFSVGFLPVGSKITEMTHRERKAILMVCRGGVNAEVVGMEVEHYYGGADYDGKKRGL